MWWVCSIRTYLPLTVIVVFVINVKWFTDESRRWLLASRPRCPGQPAARPQLHGCTARRGPCTWFRSDLPLAGRRRLPRGPSAGRRDLPDPLSATPRSAASIATVLGQTLAHKDGALQQPPPGVDRQCDKPGGRRCRSHRRYRRCRGPHAGRRPGRYARKYTRSWVPGPCSLQLDFPGWR